MGEKYRHFSREFKRDAVQLVTAKGMPVDKVARELDIHPNLTKALRIICKIKCYPEKVNDPWTSKLKIFEKIFDSIKI